MARTGTELADVTSEEDVQQAELARKGLAAAQQGRIAPGTNIDGFTVKEYFTSGGEAELYFCEAQTPGVRYVLKHEINNVVKKDKEIMDKLKSLRHPNVLPTIAYGNYKGYPYTILEFAEGGTLSDKTESGYKFLPLSEKKAEEAVAQINEAFKYIHGAGVIHRDIKPENLFYKSSDGETGSGILLGDFGILSLLDTEGGMTSKYTEHDLGTEGYEAPEMYSTPVGKDSDGGDNKQRISPAIDYYALGITLWVLLTGKEPFVDEKGDVLSPAQIMKNAMYLKTPDILLRRAPDISEKMKKLIRGLLVVNRDERWEYKKIKDHLAGKDVSVFHEALRDMKPIAIAGTECRNLAEISHALIANPREGRDLILSKKLVRHLYGLIGDGHDIQEDVDKIDAIIEDYGARAENEKQKEKDPGKHKEIVDCAYTEALFAIAYSLDPGMPFVLSRYEDENGNEKTIEVSTRDGIMEYLKTDPNVLVPVLRDPALGFYAYIDVQKFPGDISAKVREVVENTKSDLKLGPRLQIAFNNNVIAPFPDKIKENEIWVIKNIWELKDIEDLEKLPNHLRERFLIFIEMKRDDVTAWIENKTGKDLDVWLSKYKTQKDRLTIWGLWRSFRLFLDGKDVQVHKTFNKEEGGKTRWGLRNNLGDVILPPVWDFVMANSPPDRFVVKKDGKWGVIDGSGRELIGFTQDMITIFDEEHGLYQCRDGSNAWSIFDEKGNALWTGKEALKVAAAPGKPFDVIYDSAHYYKNETFEAINKEGAAFAIAGSEEGNYIWQTADGGCAVYDGSGKPIADEPLPYTGFRTGADAMGVIVQKDGNWGIASPDGSKVYIPCSYMDIKSGGGSYYALFMPSNTGGILCELVKIPSGSYEKKDLYWLRFESSGGIDILPKDGGNVIASFDSVAHLGMDYTDTEMFAPAGKMACLGNGELLWFDIATGKIDKRNVVNEGEADAILARYSGAELYALLQFLKSQGAYGGMNRLIDAASETDAQTKTSWAVDKSDGHWPKILSLIDPKHADGLSRPYDVYLSMMGAEALKSGNYHDAHKYYTSVIALKPNNASYQAGCGAAYYYIGDYANSAEFYSKAAALTTIKVLSVQYIAARGSAFFSAGKYSEAVAAFTQAITELGVQATAELYVARAACSQKLNLGDKSRSDIEAAAKAQQSSGEKIRGIPLPTAQASSVNIAQVAQSGNINTIIKALDTLKAEGSISSMNALIETSYQQFKGRGDNDNAVQVIKRLNPKTEQGLQQPVWWYYNQIGLHFFTRGKFSEAVPFFNDACALNPKEHNMLFNCGMAYYRMGSYSNAAGQFQKSAALGNAKANEELARMRREKRI